MSNWISCAKWPEGVYKGTNGDRITRDEHRTKESAITVCETLKRYGFGGQGVHFPLTTWVRPKPD